MHGRSPAGTGPGLYPSQRRELALPGGGVSEKPALRAVDNRTGQATSSLRPWSYRRSKWDQMTTKTPTPERNMQRSEVVEGGGCLKIKEYI